MKKIILNGFPKSGNHLLPRLIQILGKVRGNLEVKSPGGMLNFGMMHKENIAVFTQHISYTKEFADWMVAEDVKMITILRDLKDAVASMYRAVKEKSFHPQYLPYYKIMNKTDFINLIMDGIPDEEDRDDCATILNFKYRWLKWDECDNCYTTYFEKLNLKRL